MSPEDKRGEVVPAEPDRVEDCNTEELAPADDTTLPDSVGGRLAVTKPVEDLVILEGRFDKSVSVEDVILVEEGG